MRQYSEEFKATVISKMLPPHDIGIPELALETGIPKDTLYTWRLPRPRGGASQASSAYLAD